MKKRIALYAYSAVLFLSVPLSLGAQLLVTEVMYDAEGTDTGREWVEVQNTGQDSLDLTTFKFFEGETNHKISAVDIPSLSSGAFAVIADNPDKFRIDFPAYAGPLFDSAFSLTNDGETFEIRSSSLSMIDSFSYNPSLGANGNGFSLQKTDVGIWISVAPTPGGRVEATASETAPPTDDSPLSPSSDAVSSQNPQMYMAHSSQEVANVTFDAPDLEVSSGRTRFGFVNVPLSFETKVRSAKNVSGSASVTSTWSFGDGYEANGQYVTHAYMYPGDYTVVLNASGGGADAVSRVEVKITEPVVTISQVTNKFVEVSNDDVYELNIGGWILETERKRFIIPKDTIILPKSFVRFSFAVTGFDKIGEYVRIADPSGKILSIWNALSSFPDVEVLVTLPHGMTKESLRLSLEKVLSKQPDDAQVINATNTSTVIYAADNGIQKSWWDSFIGIFKK